MKGRKIHFPFDTIGLPICLVIHPAGIQDSDGAAFLFEKITPRLPWLECVLADTGYNAQQTYEAAEANPLRLEIVRRDPDTVGVEVIKRRWVVERTFSWFGRNRRWAKDFENLASTLLAFVTRTAIQSGIRRLARSQAFGSGSNIYSIKFVAIPDPLDWLGILLWSDYTGPITQRRYESPYIRYSMLQWHLTSRDGPWVVGSVQGQGRRLRPPRLERSGFLAHRASAHADRPTGRTPRAGAFGWLCHLVRGRHLGLLHFAEMTGDRADVRVDNLLAALLSD